MGYYNQMSFCNISYLFANNSKKQKCFNLLKTKVANNINPYMSVVIFHGTLKPASLIGLHHIFLGKLLFVFFHNRCCTMKILGKHSYILLLV